MFSEIAAAVRLLFFAQRGSFVRGAGEPPHFQIFIVSVFVAVRIKKKK